MLIIMRSCYFILSGFDSLCEVATEVQYYSFSDCMNIKKVICFIFMNRKLIGCGHKIKVGYVITVYCIVFRHKQLKYNNLEARNRNCVPCLYNKRIPEYSREILRTNVGSNQRSERRRSNLLAILFNKVTTQCNKITLNLNTDM